MTQIGWPTELDPLQRLIFMKGEKVRRRVESDESPSGESPSEANTNGEYEGRESEWSLSTVFCTIGCSEPFFISFVA